MSKRFLLSSLITRRLASTKKAANVQSPVNNDAYKAMLEAEIAAVLKFKDSNDPSLLRLIEEKRALDVEQQYTTTASISNDTVETSIKNPNETVFTNAQPIFFRQMTNEQFRHHFGLDLLNSTAKYYRIFGDAVPSSWESHFKTSDISKSFGNLKITFGKTMPQRGNVISPELTMEQPSVDFKLDKNENADEKLFTFMCIDADTPLVGDKTLTSSPLWLVSNVPVTKTETRLSEGNSVVDYIPPHPYQGIGFHRYAWLALEQTDRMDSSLILSQLENSKWNIVNYLDKSSDLYKPRGMVFHRAAWTSIVSNLYADGKIKVPHTVAVSNKMKIHASSDNQLTSGIVMIDSEPVFGRPLNRSWLSVTRRLYKYAYK